ncbi:MAG: dUTP diphosphatase [Proteobacteria bacterium]|nr:MAG: dUTP diphosphatase [Pseudomonadota bacterium]
MIDLKIKKLHEDAVIPKAATEGSAGLDLTCIEDGVALIDACGPVITFKTGLAINIPEGYAGLLIPRSSIAVKTSYVLSNSVGVLDSDYRGEITAKFRDFNEFYGGKIYKKGDRICQLVIVPVPKVNVIEVEELDDTERGEGSYGSTGD